MKCEANMEFNPDMTGCPATCVDPDAPNNCELSPQEGCQCKEGFILSGTKCVPKSQCGCQDSKGTYYNVREFYIVRVYQLCNCHYNSTHTCVY